MKFWRKTLASGVVRWYKNRREKRSGEEHVVAVSDTNDVTSFLESVQRKSRRIIRSVRKLQLFAKLIANTKIVAARDSICWKIK